MLQAFEIMLNTSWSTVGAPPGHTNKTTPLLSVHRSSYWDLSDRIWKSIKQPGTARRAMQSLSPCVIITSAQDDSRSSPTRQNSYVCN